MSGPSLIEHFGALQDPRQSWKVLFPLPEILLIVLCGTLAGAEDFVEISRWAQMNQAFLRRLLPYEGGIPSHDTLNDVMNAIDGTLFAQCFTAWVEGLREPAPASAATPEVVAIDGKTSRRTHDRGNDRGPLHLVSAWASSQRLVLGQQACEAKSNEITAIPLLLERLALTGALVTIDAMGTQTRIAQAILDRGGDYLLALKDNQASLHGEVQRCLDDPATKLHSRFETTDGDHGRIEVRRHVVSHEVDWLTTDRRFPGEPRFPGLAAIAMVEAEVERNGSTSRERRYYLSSMPLDAKLFAHAVRCHWHVENRLHWVLDVVFHEDLSRLRSGAGPQNMATVRHMAMNLLRVPKDKHSLKVRRKSAAWDTAYLEALLRQSA
ncbi:MAG: ISAs1 family transposase [Rhodospirillales bacterium]|nr:ISAs1 family transposase [Rhodospirillales bacterium]